MMPLATGHWKGGTVLWSLASSTDHVSPTSSRRPLSIWPSFTYVGPSCCSITRTLAGVDNASSSLDESAGETVTDAPQAGQRRPAGGDLDAEPARSCPGPRTTGSSR